MGELRKMDDIQEMNKQLPDDFYQQIKSQLYRRIGKELRLAYRVIDLGCGSCGLVRFLTETYGQQVTGIDIYATNFPEQDEQTTPSHGRLRCIKANARNLDFLDDGEVDAVITMWALHEMEEPLAAFQESHRVLRPGGEILIVDYPRNSLAQRLWNENYYRPQEVAGMLSRAGFDEVCSQLIEKSQVLWARGFRASQKEETA